MKDQEIIDLFIRQCRTPDDCREVNLHVVAEYRKIHDPLFEQIETYKEGLHQAKFECQVMRADLGNEQRQTDKLRTENETLRAKLFALSQPTSASVSPLVAP